MEASTRARLRKIEIASKRLLTSTLCGDYRSAFRGAGLDFHQLRDYHPGDEVRLIDWKSFARTEKVMVKEFIQERDRTVILLIDISGSLFFGSGEELKYDLVINLASALGFIAAYHHDRVGALFFSSSVQTYFPPKRGKAHLITILEKLVTVKPTTQSSSLHVAYTFLNKLKERNAIIFCLSDWFDKSSSYQAPLRIAARKHDITAFRILDPLERMPPAFGPVELQNPEHATSIISNLFIPQTTFKTFMHNYLENQKQELKKLSIDMIDFSCNAPFIAILEKFLHRRFRRGLAHV